ncbi:MAG: hypothetical protein AB7O37_01100 [Vicinamibacteria bacterium]
MPAVSAVVAIALVAFHGWLLALRLAEGALGDPAVALRWLAGFGLTAALLGLRRAGVSLFRGRKAFVFWLLVLLLHWSATAAGDRGAQFDDLILGVPASVVSLVFVATLLAGVPSGTPRKVPRWRISRIPLALRSAALGAGFVFALAARPPPL